MTLGSGPISDGYKPTEARHRLLERVPIGSPIDDLYRYLESDRSFMQDVVRRFGGEAVHPFTPGLGRGLASGRSEATRSAFSAAPKDVGGCGHRLGPGRGGQGADPRPLCRSLPDRYAILSI